MTVTQILSAVLVLANLALATWLFFGYRRLHLRLRAALRQVEDYGASAGMAIPPASASPLISVAILNPMELAVKESQLAQLFGSLAPDLVRSEVYRTVRERLAQQLLEQGVIAEVTVHRGGT
jgi:hypothetical protein